MLAEKKVNLFNFKPHDWMSIVEIPIEGQKFSLLEVLVSKNQKIKTFATTYYSKG